MAADLGLVMRAAEADPDEFAARRARNALTERGLANPRRPDKAQDWAAPVRIQLVDREEFEDAPLDLLQPVMVLVEHAARLGDVDRRLVLGRPGQLDQPFEIGAGHRILAGLFRHAFEPGELLLRVRLDLGRHPGLLDLAAQLGDFLRLGVFALAQFLLDCLQLLAQQKLTLPLVHRLLGAVVDLARQAKHFEPVGQQLRDPLQPALDVDGFEDLLLFAWRDVHEAGDQIGQRRRRHDPLHSVDQLGRGLRQQLQHFERLVAQMQHPRVDLGVLFLRLGNPDHARDKERITVEKFGDAKAPLALADHMMAAVRARHVAQQIRLGSDRVQVNRHRRVHLGIALQHQPDRAAETDRGLRRQHRALPAQRHRQDRAREQHEIARRDQDQRVFRNGRADLGAAGHDNGRRCWRRGGCLGSGLLLVRRHRHDPFSRRSIRQPLARWRPEIRNGTGGKSIRRSNCP